MTKSLFDIKKLLAHPRLYHLFKSLLRGQKVRQDYVEYYIRVKPGDKVLDIGCGIGDILDVLPDVDYYGFDMSAEYIASAKEKYNDRGTFLCNKLADLFSNFQCITR